MKKPTKTSMKRRLDKLCSEIVRKRGACQKCRNLLTLQSCHIFSRVYLNTRWDMNNLICLCASCHFWAHKNPILFTEFVKELLGEEKYELLKESHYIIYKPTIEDLLIKEGILKKL